MADPATLFTVCVEDLRYVGSGLQRPECVLCHPSGRVHVSHRGGGVMTIEADGSQRLIGGMAEVGGGEAIPNGIAVLPNGHFLVANMGPAGGVWELGPNNTVVPYLIEVDGVPLGKANFVFNDGMGRIWITVTTRSEPLIKAMAGLGQPEAADGFVCLVDRRGARIVADGLTFTNEVRVDGSGQWLYVAETFGRRISRFRIEPTGALSGREIFTSFGHGTFVDGIAFDAEGVLWAVSVVSNRVIRVFPDGSQHIVLEDSDPDLIATVESALADGTVKRELFNRKSGKALSNVSSIAFGGADLHTVYLGSLGDDRIATFRSPVAGAPLPHWTYR